MCLSEDITIIITVYDTCYKCKLPRAKDEKKQDEL